jgi:DNA-binding beta-propeller fold protein YncE
MFFKPDGTAMYVVAYFTTTDTDRVYKYNLSTAWDISTASYVQDFIIGTLEPFPNAVFFKPDGSMMFITGSNRDEVWGYYLSTAWDISTAKINPMVDCLKITGEETTPTGLFFKPDGTKMYVCGFGGDEINEYDLSTAWDINTASFLQRRSIYSPEPFVRGLFFSSDGTKMYIIGTNSDRVNQFDLSTAWDISTASLLQNLSVTSQEGFPSDLFFKPDGTKMYVIGTNGDEVNEYDLSTAWDISTASHVQLKSVSAQETAPSGLFFKSDGTKMYVTGTAGVDVNEYDLSTAWDVSTASYLQNFSVATQETSPQAISFKPDGTKMYIAGASSYGNIWAYTLS